MPFARRPGPLGPDFEHTLFSAYAAARGVDDFLDRLGPAPHVLEKLHAAGIPRLLGELPTLSGDDFVRVIRQRRAPELQALLVTHWLLDQDARGGFDFEGIFAVYLALAWEYPDCGPEHALAGGLLLTTEAMGPRFHEPAHTAGRGTYRHVAPHDGSLRAKLQWRFLTQRFAVRCYERAENTPAQVLHALHVPRGPSYPAARLYAHLARAHSQYDSGLEEGRERAFTLIRDPEVRQLAHDLGHRGWLLECHNTALEWAIAAEHFEWAWDEYHAGHPLAHGPRDRVSPYQVERHRVLHARLLVNMRSDYETADYVLRTARRCLDNMDQRYPLLRCVVDYTRLVAERTDPEFLDAVCAASRKHLIGNWRAQPARQACASLDPRLRDRIFAGIVPAPGTPTRYPDYDFYAGSAPRHPGVLCASSRHPGSTAPWGMGCRKAAEAGATSGRIRGDWTMTRWPCGSRAWNASSQLATVSHVGHVVRRFTSILAWRAETLATSSSWGTSLPVPKYISSGVWPRNAEWGRWMLCCST